MTRIEYVKKLADLAELSLTEEELDIVVKHLDNADEMIEALNSVDTKNIKPTYRGTEELVNVLRKDEVKEAVSPEALLQQAPARVGSSIQVPQILSDSKEEAN